MIGKTRQSAESQIGSVDASSSGRSRGVLGWTTDPPKFAVSRHPPMAGLGFCIAYYWTVSWDLRGREPHAQETLPHPNVYLVFEDEKLVVSGVSTAKFSRLLRGKSRVFGVKFKPGGFRPYLKDSVSSITDVVKPAGGIFGADADAFESRLLAATAEEEMVAAADAFFRARIPKPDGSIALATNLVERILNRSEIKTVDRLAEDAGIAKRSLQRIFNEYVGVSPKWVIRRYRLHELVERLNSGEELDWPDVAVELGYFDQAHLINDFRSIVGYSPTRYQPGNAKD